MVKKRRSRGKKVASENVVGIDPDSKMKTEIIPPSIFNVIHHYVTTHEVQTPAVVGLIMKHYKMRRLNPRIACKPKGQMNPDVIVFCMKFLEIDVVQPLGAIMFDIKQSERYVASFAAATKAFIHDLNLLNLKVVMSVSPPQPIFRKILVHLIQHPNFGVEAEPMVYQAAAGEVVHIYDLFGLMSNFQDMFYESQEIYYLTYTDGLKWLKASFADIMNFLVISKYETSYTDPSASKVYLFSMAFYYLYRLYFIQGLLPQSNTLRDTTLLLRVFGPFVHVFYGLYHFTASQLEDYYDSCEDFRLMLASILFKSPLNPEAMNLTDEDYANHHREFIKRMTYTGSRVPSADGGYEMAILVLRQTIAYLHALKEGLESGQPFPELGLEDVADTTALTNQEIPVEQIAEAIPDITIDQPAEVTIQSSSEYVNPKFEALEMLANIATKVDEIVDVIASEEPQVTLAEVQGDVEQKGGELLMKVSDTTISPEVSNIEDALSRATISDVSQIDPLSLAEVHPYQSELSTLEQKETRRPDSEQASVPATEPMAFTTSGPSVQSLVPTYSSVFASDPERKFVSSRFEEFEDFIAEIELEQKELQIYLESLPALPSSRTIEEQFECESHYLSVSEPDPNESGSIHLDQGASVFEVETDHTVQSKKSGKVPSSSTEKKTTKSTKIKKKGKSKKSKKVSQSAMDNECKPSTSSERSLKQKAVSSVSKLQPEQETHKLAKNKVAIYHEIETKVRKCDRQTQTDVEMVSIACQTDDELGRIILPTYHDSSSQTEPMAEFDVAIEQIIETPYEDSEHAIRSDTEMLSMESEEVALQLPTESKRIPAITQKIEDLESISEVIQELEKAMENIHFELTEAPETSQDTSQEPEQPETISDDYPGLKEIEAQFKSEMLSSSRREEVEFLIPIEPEPSKIASEEDDQPGVISDDIQECIEPNKIFSIPPKLEELKLQASVKLKPTHATSQEQEQPESIPDNYPHLKETEVQIKSESLTFSKREEVEFQIPVEQETSKIASEDIQEFVEPQEKPAIPPKFKELQLQPTVDFEPSQVTSHKPEQLETISDDHPDPKENEAQLKSESLTSKHEEVELQIPIQQETSKITSEKEEQLGVISDDILEFVELEEKPLRPLKLQATVELEPSQSTSHEPEQPESISTKSKQVELPIRTEPKPKQTTSREPKPKESKKREMQVSTESKPSQSTSQGPEYLANISDDFQELKEQVQKETESVVPGVNIRLAELRTRRKAYKKKENFITLLKGLPREIKGETCTIEWLASLKGLVRLAYIMRRYDVRAIRVCSIGMQPLEYCMYVYKIFSRVHATPPKTKKQMIMLNREEVVNIFKVEWHASLFRS